MSFRDLVALALVGLGLNACGTALSPGDGPEPYSSDPDALILRVERVGGSLPPEHRLRELPMFSLYGDGRVFTLGAQIEIYPPPALHPLVVKKLSPKGIQAILQEARNAGLMNGPTKIDHPRIMDAPTTVFTVNAEDSHRVEVYALDEASDDSDPQRARLKEFQRKVTDPTWLPEGSIESEETSVEPERLQVIAFVPDPQLDHDDGIDPGTYPWPLGIPISSFGASFESAGLAGNCAIVEGDQLASMIRPLRESNLFTRWTSEGKGYRLITKPLLPGDGGCLFAKAL